ncbi:MAG: 8-oxo-dGTP diphosphatase MutT [Gammaproteobacteria bacterium]
MSAAQKPEIEVAAGVLTDAAGRTLIACRPEDGHLGGWWEFPGGKLDARETPLQGLTRELHEELGIKVRAATPLVEYTHEYRDRIVRLHVWRVTQYDGEPTGIEGQPIKWTRIQELPEAGLLPADLPIIDVLLDSERGPER